MKSTGLDIEPSPLLSASLREALGPAVPHLFICWFRRTLAAYLFPLLALNSAFSLCKGSSYFLLSVFQFVLLFLKILFSVEVLSRDHRLMYRFILPSLTRSSLCCHFYVGVVFYDCDFHTGSGSGFLGPSAIRTTWNVTVNLVWTPAVCVLRNPQVILILA